MNSEQLLPINFSFFLTLFPFLLFFQSTYSQKNDTSTLTKPVFNIIKKSTKQEKRDSILFTKKQYFLDSSFSPRKAALHSAMIPGWGQVYNKQTWKVPLVYAALGITTGTFFYYLSAYTQARNAYTIRYNNDIANFGQITDPTLLLITLNSLKYARNQYRHFVDLSVLAFLIEWGINVVDASVSAHLKQFNVSDDLSMKIIPKFDNNQSSISFVFQFKNKIKSPSLISK